MASDTQQKPTNEVKKPEGFQPLTLEQLQQEAALASVNDRGMHNVYFYDKKGISEDSLNARVTEYDVNEERRFNGWKDTSLQDVAYAKAETIDHADLTSIRDGVTVTLIGQSDGKVLMEANGTSHFIKDITEAAAKTGITAAGIRRTEKDIAMDGEVSRPEQQRIIDIINKAKPLAGIR